MVRDTNAIDGSTTDELMAEISQYWANLEGTNIYNLVDSFNEPMTGLSQTAQKIENWREIKNAEGTTLDLMGRDREAYRPSDDDDVYRFLIYIRYLLSKAQGTIPSIVNITSTALQTDGGVDVFDTKMPHHIGIKIPANRVKNVEMQKFVIDKLQQMIALGYWLDVIVFYAPTQVSGYVGAATTDKTDSHSTSVAKWWTGYKGTTFNHWWFGTDIVEHSEDKQFTTAIWWDGYKGKTSSQVQATSKIMQHTEDQQTTTANWWRGYQADIKKDLSVGAALTDSEENNENADE